MVLSLLIISSSSESSDEPVHTGAQSHQGPELQCLLKVKKDLSKVLIF